MIKRISTIMASFVLIAVGFALAIGCSPKSSGDNPEKDVKTKTMTNETTPKESEKISVTEKQMLDEKIPEEDTEEDSLEGVGEVKLGSCQGVLNWNQAMEKCKSQGKRLPTKDELMVLARSMEVISDCVEGDDTMTLLSNWSSTESTPEKAYFVGVSYDGGGHWSQAIPKIEKAFVNCVQ